MIIYEVNLTIDPAIFADYYTWLQEHVKIMLDFRGFKHATIAQDETDPHKLTVCYQVVTRDDLENYFNNHASAMRDDGIKQFGNQFSATRRVFTVMDVMAHEPATS